MKKIKIVLAEDFELLRKDIKESLEIYEELEIVGDFATGKETADFVIANDVDVVLMDIDMETRKAGIEFAKKILYNKRVAILFLTAYENENFILSGMETGALDYIVKDTPIEDIRQKILDAYNEEVKIEPRINKTLLDEYTRLRTSERSLLFFINNVGKLTKTEKTLVKYLLENKTNKEIAEKRKVEVVTIKTQVRSLLKKFGCNRKKEIAKMINDLGIIDLFMEEEEE